MIGVDTFTWNKLFRLRESKWKQIIEDIIIQMNFFITIDGKKEFEYRFPAMQEILDQIIILPVIKSQVYANYIKKGFDNTDASLLEYNHIKGYKIITEDHPMLVEGASLKKNIIQLVDFMYELYMRESFLSRTEFFHIVKELRKWKNITKKKEKYYLKIRKEEV